MKNKRSFLVLILSYFLVTNMAIASKGDVAFSGDFREGCNAEGWTALDVNSDGVTWNVDQQLNGYIYNGNTTDHDAEEWLFTPSFTVEGGKYYILQFTIAQRGAYDADHIVVGYGDEAAPGAMKNTIIEESFNMHGGMTTRSYRLYFAESGNCHVGLKLTSKAGNGIVSLKQLSVVEADVCTPQPVPAMVANMDSATASVELKWVNPKKDSDNILIGEKMDAIIYEDDEQVAVIEGVTPGQEQSYVMTPSSFAGEHTVSVAVSVNGIVSEKVSKKLNYDDIQGALEPVYTFPLKSKTDFAAWKVTNADNDAAKWEYYSSTAYISAFGKNVNDWVITPGYELEPGKRYVLTYELASGRDYPASLDVTMGTQQSSAWQNKVLISYTDLYQNGLGKFESPQFVVEEAGTYYFGFHALYVGNSLTLKNVTINYVKEGGGSSEKEDLEYEEVPEPVASDNINGDLDITEPYHQNLSSDGVELYAAYTNALIDEYTLAPNGIYHLVQQPEKFGVDFSNPEKEINLGGGMVYHEGRIYCNEYDASANVQEQVPVWKILDGKTYEVISETQLKDNCENTTVAMAYDATSDKIYGFVKDYVDTYLVEINPADGSMTRMGGALDYRHRYLALACNVKGELYCVYMTEDSFDGEQKQFLARINTRTGAIATVGEITGLNMLPSDMLINFKMRQSMFFNNQTGKLYWYFCSSSAALGSQYGAIFEVNPINANAVLQTWRTDVFAISGAFFAEPNINAPGIISNVKYTPDEAGSLSGKLTFTLPAVDYVGNAISGKLDYKVLLASDRSVLLEGDGQAGENISIDYTTTEGIFDLALVAYNESGPSVDKNYTILVGYDKPAAPQNLWLTDTDWITTELTWDAPAAGVHGMAYDKNRLTYNVYKYPDGENPVATGLTEPYYKETHGDNMQRCLYAVFSCCDGKQIQAVISNAVVIGKPLTPPYGGLFTTAADMYDYYTIIDNNKDNHTWTFDSYTGAAYYPYNYQLAADDWMISPPIDYKKGAEYKLTFSAFSVDSDCLESLLVTFGEGKTPEKQSTVLIDMPELPAIEDDGTINVYSIDIKAPESGVYYYGFKAYSPEMCNYLYLYDIKLEMTKDNSVHGVESYNRDFDAYYYNKGVSVVNPLGTTVSIYNLNGLMLHQSCEANYNVTLDPGVYLVRSAKSVVKVVVR